MKKNILYLFITLFLFNQVLLAKPMKPLYEILCEQYYYELNLAKTKEEKKKVYEKFKKRTNIDMCRY